MEEGRMKSPIELQIGNVGPATHRSRVFRGRARFSSGTGYLISNKRLSVRSAWLPIALIALALCSLARPASAQQWVDSRVCGPFVCRAEFALAPYSALLEQLGQLQDDLVRHLGIPPAEEPVAVYLFRDKNSYRRYLKRHLPGVPYRRALYVKSQQTGRVFAYRSREFETDLRHECTHALLHAVLPVVPLWLDEGLAEYFEVLPRQRAFENPHLGSLKWNLRLGMTPKLEKLERTSSIEDMGKAEYRNAWAWVHFMLHGPREAHQELVEYLRRIRANSPPGLLSERLKQRFKSPRGSLAAHFRTWKR